MLDVENLGAARKNARKILGATARRVIVSYCKGDGQRAFSKEQWEVSTHGRGGKQRFSKRKGRIFSSETPH